MANSYENIPVFRSNEPYVDPEQMIGSAKVEVDEENNRTTITIESFGDWITDFLNLGDLKALGLNAMVVAVDEAAAAEYWARYEPEKKSLWDQRTER